MNNRPTKITLFSETTKKRRTIHIITHNGEKTFKSTSAICKYWVLNNQFPTVFKVSYGNQETINGNLKEFTNEMLCSNLEDLGYALTVFVKERQTI